MPSILRPAIFRFIFPVLLLASWGSAQVNVLGLVVNAETDLPVPRARFFGPDSGFLGSADASGRFELRLAGAITVTVRQDGYRSATVALSEVPDLLDVVVALEPTGTRLEERVVTGRAGRRVRVPGSLPRIEEITGMRFDLQDHLRVLPGVSGTREFSSEVSVYGSRSADVSHTLGQFSVPNLRHLDFAFPGNQSVLNPRAVSGIFVEHDPSKGPLEQGLASALRYNLRQAPTDRYDATVALGLTNRELFLTGPIGPGGLTLSGRWLDPSLLRHLGDRFYAGSTRAPEDLEDSARQGASSDFDLQAFDGLARYDWSRGRLRGAVAVIGGYDKYRLSVYRQDTILTDISRGRAGSYVAFGEVEGDASWGYWQAYGGRVYRGDLEAIRDTVPTGEQGFDDPARAYDRGAYRSDRTDDRIGFVLRPETPVLGAEAEILAAGHYIVDEREQGRSLNADEIGDVVGALGLAASDELAYLRGRIGGRLRWPLAGGTLGLSAGALVVQDETPAPEASVSWVGPYGSYGLNANLSLRQQEYAYAESFGKLANRITNSYEAKAGAGRSFLGELDVSATAYGRLIDNPVLPHPAVWWALPESREADDAYALGATAQIDWRGWHHFQVQTNVSHVRGEYRMTEGEWLAWEASRDLDLQTFFKIHPRSDTLLAVIFSHSATLGQPYYRHERDVADSTRSVHSARQTELHPEYSDFFRTDVRVQLDLPSAIRPFTGFRFYFEGQNLFSEFDGDWARWLGSENYKQRSWEFAGDRSSLDPYLTRGLGLFFSFGIEGTLSL